MRKILIQILVLSTLTLGACSVYRPPIQQGNILDDKDIAKLELGMSKRQVTFVMGTALLRDPFHHDRWDYMYTLKEAGKKTVMRRLTLYFEQDSLIRIDDSALQPVSLNH